MRLDPAILADLAVAFTPKSYVRVTPLAHAATPLGAGYGVSRFASPTKAFKVIYLGQDLTTSVAETIVRDRFQGKAQRRLMLGEVDHWGATEVSATTPLTLVDLRTTGLVRLGVSTEAARGKAQGQGRKLSQAVHDQTDADGLLYLSRLTGRTCVCVYERALPGPLVASPVMEVARLAGFVGAVQALNVSLITSAS
ncbi:MAG TPA: RES family NAD+ phosphorylase [Phenylobacterium sp.]|uniref:RES family NAD+ phosphorylase n=1 Tax=Phenylobacterium sp. TaxID=1871053 RepID=UPI002B47AB2B|nr:RES family NAD+ phosphorylase [Phenylobacterium sp.]HKR87980.1 RES family NAD+ phosphorylase [Phenylobacterium sp.]HKT52970.1 RES family NAD+ phosphorylase [Caulobacteraceae bacterium]